MSELIQRFGDMSTTARLQIHQQDDGDMVIGIFKNDADEKGWVSVEFCSPFAGGGKSPHTVKALRDLMEAVIRDNTLDPDRNPYNQPNK